MPVSLVPLMGIARAARCSLRLPNGRAAILGARWLVRGMQEEAETVCVWRGEEIGRPWTWSGEDLVRQGLGADSLAKGGYNRLKPSSRIRWE
jgi:hypothetical protein